MKFFEEVVNAMTGILSKPPFSWMLPLVIFLSLAGTAIRCFLKILGDEPLSIFDLFCKKKKEPEQDAEKQTEIEQEDFPAREIQVYNVLLDRELFHFKGDWAMEEKGDHCTVYYTENGEHKKFEFDMSNHIAVYKDIA